MEHYKEARRIFYLALPDEEFEYNLEDGEKVRKALYEVRRRSSIFKVFKSVKTKKRIIIWQEVMT